MITAEHVRTLLLSSSVAVLGFALACDAQVGPDHQGDALARVNGTVVGTTPETSDALEVAALWFSSSPELECSGPAPACDVAVGGSLDVDFACLEACGHPDACDAEVLDAFVACSEMCGASVQAEYSVSWELCADAAVATTVPVMGQFPAMFELDLFAPPPDEALLTSDEDGPAVALGWLLVVDDDAPTHVDFNAVDESGLPGVLGVAERHMLMYAADPIPADSAWGQLLGGAYEPGYHVLQVIGGECWEEPVYPDGACMIGEECPGPEETETVCELATLEPSAADLDTAITVTLGAWNELRFPLPG